MAWQKKVAHQITRGHLSRSYNIQPQYLLTDPVISDLPFFNADVSEDVRRNEMRLVAGKLIRFLISLNLDREEGSDLNNTFDQLVTLMTDGQGNSSEIGVLVDACFKCIDEE